MPTPIETIFDNLDRWRHFPAYQLERRADVFFSIYLREVVAAFTDTPLRPTVIPELPIKLGLIWPDNESNQSVKVDYCLFADDGSRVFFVELKTDGGSRRSKQDEYLQRAEQLGFRSIAAGVRDIALASTSHQKYFHLLHELADLGFLSLPPDLTDFLFPIPRSGLQKQLKKVEVLPPDPAVEVIYLQPRAAVDDRCIDFPSFAEHVETHSDPLSQAFASYLRRWATSPAGAEPPSA